MASKERSTGPTVRRLAAQSIRDEKERLTNNRLVPFYFSSVFAWLLWGWEQYKARTHMQPHPTIFLCLAVVLTGITAIVFSRLYFRFRNLNRGERGELSVAETLESLRAFGYRPVHDIKRNGFNIDHVMVGPAGVFAIETKFRSGYGEIEFRNGDGLFVGSRREEGNPLHQARTNAREISRLLQEYCGKHFWVQPVVVYVGDWKIKNDWQSTDARVFTPNRLLHYLDDQQPQLTRSEIKLIASHLERSVKS